MTKAKILDVGKSCRLEASAAALLSGGKVEVCIVSEVTYPALEALAADVQVHASDDPEFVANYGKQVGAEFAFIGPEEPLAAGVVDRLLELGIPSVGPTRDLAQIETSKSFTRHLLTEFGIPGNPEYEVFESEAGLERYMRRLGEFVIKPDGLTGGKGVRVWGDHFHSVEEGLSYCRDLFNQGGHVVIEEKLDGEEFTFQSFCDGTTVKDTIPVQDHKRLLDGDKGPNTGGMGSYSCEDHLLPFLTADDVAQASETNRRVADALFKKTGQPYKGILYGSFIVTRKGLRVIEYNARFGDPEAMNIFAVLETDFVDVCRAIISGSLDKLPITFARKATVCKYVVPEGYPEAGLHDVEIILPEIDNTDPSLRMYCGAVKTGPDGSLLMTGSRAVVFVGIGDTLEEAEAAAERGAMSVKGPVHHRRDIGTSELIRRRVEHVQRLRLGSGEPARRYA